MSTPKRHHYVPRFYLAGFAEADGGLRAHDLDTGAVRGGTVETEGVVKHFYRVSIGDDVSVVERKLADIETGASRIFREVERSHDLPTSKSDLEELLFFIALQSQRVVRSLDAIEALMKLEGRRLRGETSPEIEESFRLAEEDMTKDGYRPVERTSLDQIGVRVVDGEVIADRDAMIMQMLCNADMAHRQLVKRTWMLAIVPDGYPELVTSDSPVNAVFSTGTGTSAINTGFHFPDRTVVYPMTRRIGLLGYADSRKRYRAMPATEKMIGFFNWATLMGARRFAWSRRPRVFHVAGDGIYTETSYIVSLRKRAREAREQQAKASKNRV